MHRVIVLYEQEPDAGPYAEHAELFGHGAERRLPPRHGHRRADGRAAHAYYAEWEFADRDAFDAVRPQRRSSSASGKDAYKRGFPQPAVEFARALVSDSAAELVLVERDGRVGVVLLNRPSS